jgi:hypothetical protein
MLQVTILLYVLSLYFLIQGMRQSSADKKNLAMTLFLAALGSTMITYFALSAI